MKDKTLKGFGFLAVAVSLLASLAGSVISEARVDKKLDEKVAKALADRNE